MKTEERVKLIVDSHKSENDEQFKKFSETAKRFDKMVNEGLIKKRGNQLASTTEITNNHVHFNV